MHIVGIIYLASDQGESSSPRHAPHFAQLVSAPADNDVVMRTSVFEV
jgi:hypothetical protein